MSVFSCYEYSGITDNQFFQYLKDAVTAASWSIDQYSNACHWEETTPPGYYDFAAGDEGSLIISSNGYGSQTLHYRIRRVDNGSNPDSAWIEIGAFRAGTTALDHTSATKPCGNGHWNSRNSNKSKYMSIPRAIERCYIFVLSKKFVVASIVCAESYCLTIAFGSPEVVDPAKTDCQFCGYNLDDGLYFDWSDQKQKDPFFQASETIYYNGNVPSTNMTYSLYNTSYNGTSFTGKFHSYANMINSTNAYSDIQPMFKPIIYCKNSLSFWEGIGTLPIFRAKFMENYSVGQLKTYGTKKYRMFPSGKNSRTAGFAIRIA